MHKKNEEKKLDGALTPQQVEEHSAEAHASKTPAAIATGMRVYTMSILIGINEQCIGC